MGVVVGRPVGDAVGLIVVGPAEGALEGDASKGDAVGAASKGDAVGVLDGEAEGFLVGTAVVLGRGVACCVGASVPLMMI